MTSLRTEPDNWPKPPKKNPNPESSKCTIQDKDIRSVYWWLVRR